MKGFERADVRVFRCHDLLGKPEPTRWQIVELVHRTVVLKFVGLADRGEERQDDESALHRCRHLEISWKN